MFNLKRRRKAKGAINNSRNDQSAFDAVRFSDLIVQISSLFPENTITEWSRKKEWMEFSKLLFSTARPKEKYIRKAYDFFSEKSTTNTFKYNSNKK